MKIKFSFSVPIFDYTGLPTARFGITYFGCDTLSGIVILQKLNLVLATKL